MGVVAAIVSVVSSVAGFVGKRRQEKKVRAAMEQAQAEERKQRAIANRQAALDRRRSIRQSIAATRVTQAQLVNQSFGIGGSATSGALSATGTDLATAIGASQTQFAAQSGIAASQNRQASALQTAQNAANGTNFWTGLAQVGSIFSDASTLRGLSNFTGIGTGIK